MTWTAQGEVSSARRRGELRRRALAAAASLAVNGLLVLAVICFQTNAREPAEPEAVLVEIDPPSPSPTPAASLAPAGSAAEALAAGKPVHHARTQPVTPTTAKPKTIVQAKAVVTPARAVRLGTRAAPTETTSDAAEIIRPAGFQYASQGDGAGDGTGTGSGAGEGSGSGFGGACDMAKMLEAKLRKDPLVQAAVAPDAGRTLHVWAGDWVLSDGEDGKGLAVLRQAIEWDVSFAPSACLHQAMHGQVLLSINAFPGAPKVALGQGAWRWSDLRH